MRKTNELIVNTGPLLALIAGLGELSLIEKVYKRVIVPFEVCKEIESGGKTNFGIREFVNANFIEKVSSPIVIQNYLSNVLDLGEASVIQLALNENIKTVCIDEAMGRRVARLNGLKVTGSIGVLIRAKQEGSDFSMHEVLNRMKNHGIYLSQNVIDFALKEVNEIK